MKLKQNKSRDAGKNPHQIEKKKKKRLCIAGKNKANVIDREGL